VGEGNENQDILQLALESPRYDTDDANDGAQALFTRVLEVSSRTGRVAMAIHISALYFFAKSLEIYCWYTFTAIFITIGRTWAGTLLYAVRGSIPQCCAELGSVGRASFNTICVVVVIADSKGREQFRRPLRKGSNSNRHYHLSPAHPFVTHMLFSTWCWSSSGGQVELAPSCV